MKCPKCGCEFEGNFCPNCGTVVGEVTRCPVCGKERTNNERFCSGCGYAYEKPEQKKEIDAPVTLYKALHLTPLILFAVMAVLAFLFSIAPAISGMGSVSAYGLLGDDSFDGMQGTAIFLLITELIFLIAAAALAYFTYKFKSTGDKRFYTVLKANVAASAAYYLILFIIGIVMCAQVGAYDDGWGLFSVGACPVLFIVFSLLFGIAEAASVILSNQLVKKYPQLKEVKLVAESSAVGVSVGGAAVQGAGQATAVKKERAPLTAQAKKKIAVFGVLLAIVIIAVIVIVVICNSLSNIFRIGKVSQINLGDSKSQVVEILGEPDEYTETTYSYYSDNYNKILKEINSFDEDDIDDWDDLFAAAEQEAELYEELESLTYQRIDVTFSDGEVTAIYFDASCCDSKDSSKTLETVTVLSGEVLQYSASAEITYEAEFSDGSYLKDSATATPADNATYITASVGNEIELTWSDKLYSNYSENFTVTGSNAYTIVNSVLYVYQEEIDASTFADIDKTAITSIEVTESVQSIDAGTFSGFSNLVSITLPFVGSRASTTSAANSTLFGYIFGSTEYDNTTAIEQSYDKSSSTTYYIPTTLKTVTITGGNMLYGAFSNCSNLTSISIPDSATSIGGYAFDSCTSLTNITIPQSVTSISGYAFNNCTSLTSIIIPDNVTSISSYAFNNCTSLNKATIGICPSRTYTIFEGCTALTSITLSNGVTSIGSSAFDNCTSLTSIIIGNSVTSIGGQAFRSCTSLESITIPDSVTSIAQQALEGCISLTSVTV